jgi:hypothetical protein
VHKVLREHSVTHVSSVAVLSEQRSAQLLSQGAGKQRRQEVFFKKVLKLFLLSFTTLAFAGHLCVQLQQMVAGTETVSRDRLPRTSTSEVKRIPTIRN